MAVGDTAGHVLPAVAVADAYREAWGDVEISFFAGAGGSAHRLIPSTAYSLHILPATPLVRVSPAGRVMGALRVAPTFTRARALLQRLGIRLVIGTGGYGSGGALLAARSPACTPRSSNRTRFQGSRTDCSVAWRSAPT